MANVEGLTPQGDDGFRKWLALALTVASFVIVLGLGLGSLLLARGDGATALQSFTYAKEILGILLPVASAWMGTIIAYYFSRENFEAATRSTMSLVKQLTPDEKLAAIPITEGIG